MRQTHSLIDRGAVGHAIEKAYLIEADTERPEDASIDLLEGPFAMV